MPQQSAARVATEVTTGTTPPPHQPESASCVVLSRVECIARRQSLVGLAAGRCPSRRRRREGSARGDRWRRRAATGQFHRHNNSRDQSRTPNTLQRATRKAILNEHHTHSPSCGGRGGVRDADSVVGEAALVPAAGDLQRVASEPDTAGP